MAWGKDSEYLKKIFILNSSFTYILKKNLYTVDFRLTLGGKNSFKIYSNFQICITGRGVNRQNVIDTLH